MKLIPQAASLFRVHLDTVAVFLPLLLGGGEGRGEEAACLQIKNPLSPALSPLVPRGEREPDSNGVKMRPIISARDIQRCGGRRFGL